MPSFPESTFVWWQLPQWLLIVPNKLCRGCTFSVFSSNSAILCSILLFLSFSSSFARSRVCCTLRWRSSRFLRTQLSSPQGQKDTAGNSMAQIPHSFKHQPCLSCQKMGTQDKKLQQWMARTIDALYQHSRDTPKTNTACAHRTFCCLHSSFKIKHLDTGTYRCQEQCDHIYSQRCLSESPFLLLLQLLPSQLLSFLLLPQSLQLLPLFFLRGIEMSLYPVGQHSFPTQLLWARAQR